MKGGLAVLLRLAEELHADPRAARHDVTLAFYEGEEVADEFNGLRQLFDARPELLAGDFAVLLEPTDGVGRGRAARACSCAKAAFDGERAHTGAAVDGRQRHPPRRRRARPPRRARVRHRRRRRPRVPRVAPGRRAGGRRPGQAQRGARRVHDHRRTGGSRRATRWRRRRRRCARCSTAPTTVEVLQAPAGALPNLTDPLVAEFVERPRPAGATEAGLDRRRAVRGARHPGAELRSRRPRDRAHRGGVRHPGVDRAVLRRSVPFCRSG